MIYGRLLLCVRMTVESGRQMFPVEERIKQEQLFELGNQNHFKLSSNIFSKVVR